MTGTVGIVTGTVVVVTGTVVVVTGTVVVVTGSVVLVAGTVVVVTGVPDVVVVTGAPGVVVTGFPVVGPDVVVVADCTVTGSVRTAVVDVGDAPATSLDVWRLALGAVDLGAATVTPADPSERACVVLVVFVGLLAVAVVVVVALIPVVFVGVVRVGLGITLGRPTPTAASPNTMARPMRHTMVTMVVSFTAPSSFVLETSAAVPEYHGRRRPLGDACDRSAMHVGRPARNDNGGLFLVRRLMYDGGRDSQHGFRSALRLPRAAPVG